MILKTLQWNIGGGKIRGVNDNVNEQFGNSIDGLDHISKTIKKLDPDIVTFQEVHFDEESNQVKELANKIDYPFGQAQIFEKESHLDQTKKWGLGVMSKFPLTDYLFTPFLNLHWTRENPKGDLWKSFNYGAMTNTINLPNKIRLQIKNVHIPSFATFREDPLSETNKILRDDISSKINLHNPLTLIQGDFNFDNPSLRKFLPDIFNNNLQEIILDKPTTPRKMHVDHILFSGLKHLKSEIIEDVLTDHYPIYSEFEV